MHRSHGLTPPSTARRDIDDTQSRPDYGHLPTPVHGEHHHTLWSSQRFPRAPAESTPVAEDQERPFQGLFKCTKIGNETTYTPEFQLSHVPEHLHLPVLYVALGMRSNKETSEEAATPPTTIAHSKVWPATLQSKRKGVSWRPEENETIHKMKGEGYSWEEIHAALPHRTPGAIQVQYSTKLKKQSPRANLLATKPLLVTGSIRNMESAISPWGKVWRCARARVGKGQAHGLTRITELGSGFAR
jgi:hypothetical protein